MIGTDRYLRLERAESLQETETGLEAQLGGERLRVDVVRADVLRLAVSQAGRFEESPSHAVCVDPLSQVPSFRVERAEQAGTVRLYTDAVVLTVELDPFRIDLHRVDGSPVVETATDDQGRTAAYATLNDSFVLRRRYRPDDAIYGLGEKTGPHNRRGTDYTLWNLDVLNPYAGPELTASRLPVDHPQATRITTNYDPCYIGIPLFYHHRFPEGTVSASFVDNPYRAHYDFSRPDSYSIHFDGGRYVEYLFAGPTMAGILEAYTWLTGRLSLPPLWALGYHQCRWYAYTQDEVEALGARHRELGIPCDSLWLDIDYMDGYRVFTWNEERFPDPRAMLEHLAADGFRLVTIIDPGVKYEPGYWVFDEGVARDVLCRTEGGGLYVGQVWPGNTAFPDFSTKAGRDWWGQLNVRHVASGVAGIWNDMNEPATGAIEPYRMRFDGGRQPHERYHNQYALLMAMGTTEGLLQAMPDRRPFVLSRSGFAGIQRYAANWLGDHLSRWDHLGMGIPMAMGLGLSGQPFVGADIGGFSGNCPPELFVRWMQYGTLTPFCRNHTEIGTTDQYAWSFGPAVQELVTEAIRLRYRLLPYLYACFVRAAETGAPVQRPLVFDYQHDPLVVGLDDQYLLGPDLLVAPILAAGATARQVYLPEGRWYDWQTGETLDGGRYVVASAPMDRIPLYARGGSVVPLWPDAPASTDGYRPEVIQLHLFVPDDGGALHQSLLQEDDGTSRAALEGAYLRTTFTVTRTGSRLRLAATVEGDGYPDHARRQFHLHVHGADVTAMTVDGEPVIVDDHVAVLTNPDRGFQAELTLG